MVYYILRNSQTSRRIALYITVSLGTYFISKKFFPEKTTPKSELDVRVRRGDRRVRVYNHVLELLSKDRAVRITIIATFATIIGTEFHEEIVQILLRSSPAILADPDNKLELSLKVKRMLRAATLVEMKEILLDKTLTNKDKLIFLKLKILGILKGLKGRKRLYFIMTLLSLLIFLFGNNTPAFVFFWSNLRELFKNVDLDEYVIELYKEFNTTIPEELINNIIQ